MHAALPAKKMTEAEQPDSGAVARTWFARFRQTPFILQSYVVFVIVASALASTVFFAWPLHRAIAPYLGGNLMLYLFAIYPAIASASQRKLVYAVVPILLVAIGAGIIDLALAWKNPTMLQANPTNPYLEYATVRPVVTIVMPLAWMLLLCSPMMRKWIRESNNPGTPSRHQFSLMDLLYVTMVAAICLALSLALVEIVKQKKASLAGVHPKQGSAS